MAGERPRARPVRSGLPAGIDGRIAMLAASQEGVVSTRQLNALGLGRGAIRHRLAVGRLHRVHPRVVALLPRISRTGELIAALLATAPSYVCHRSAGEWFGALSPLAGPVHVSVAHGRSIRCGGVVVHRTRCLPTGSRRVFGPVRVTSPARTLADLAGSLPAGQLARAHDEMLRRRLCDRREVLAECALRPNVRGIGALRSLSARWLPLDRTRSPLEASFLRFCVERHLPIPAVNELLLGFEVDCLWIDARLVVELDGGVHDTPAARAADALRDERLSAAGFSVLRIGEEALRRRPGWLAAELRARLRSPGAPAGTR